MERAQLIKIQFPSLLVALAPGALAFLGQEDGLDVGKDAALGDGHPGQQLVKLLVVPVS